MIKNLSLLSAYIRKEKKPILCLLKKEKKIKWHLLYAKLPAALGRTIIIMSYSGIPRACSFSFSRSESAVVPIGGGAWWISSARENRWGARPALVRDIYFSFDSFFLYVVNVMQELSFILRQGKHAKFINILASN